MAKTRHKIIITVEFDGDEEVENDADSHYALRLMGELEDALEEVVDSRVYHSPLCNSEADMVIKIDDELVL